MFGSARLPKLAAAISSLRAWVTGTRNRRPGSVVVAPFPVTLTMCVTVKANALYEERVRGTDVDIRADTGFVVAFAQNGLPMNFRDLSWSPPLFSPHKMAKKITDYRDTPALKSHSL